MAESNKKNTNKPNKEQTQKPRKPKPAVEELIRSAPPDQVALQQAINNPEGLTAKATPAVQRTVGNRTAQQLISSGAASRSEMSFKLNVDSQDGAYGDVDLAQELESIVNQHNQLPISPPDDNPMAIEELSLSDSNEAEAETADQIQQGNRILKAGLAGGSQDTVIYQQVDRSDSSAFNQLSRELIDFVHQRSSGILSRILAGSKSGKSIEEEEEFDQTAVLDEERGS